MDVNFENLKKCVDNKMTNEQIMTEFKISNWKLRQLLSLHSIKKDRRLNLVGKKFGNLLVIRSKKIKNILKWECECVCGKVIYVNTGHLTGGGYTSCGCSRGKRKSLNVRWKGYGDISGFMWKGIYLTFKKNKRVKDFSITIEYIWNLFVKQGGRCNLSGLSIEFAKTNELHKIGGTTASLDRIDSTKGYIEGNVQWVHKDVNKLKSNFKQDYFLNLCKIIGKYNK